MRTRNSKKRILIFIQNGLGGAEKVSIEIAKMLLSDNWKVTFVICMFSKTNKENKLSNLLPHGAHCEVLTIRSQIGFIIGIYKTIALSSPDVVFCSAMHINQRLLLISTLFPKIRFVVRNDNYLSVLSALKKKTLKYTYKLADIIISQTEEMEKELIALGLNSSKIKTLKNPINEKNIILKANAPSPYPITNDKIFVAVGRLSYQKGFDILIEAFNMVCNKIPNSRLYIIGNTEYLGGKIYLQLKNQIKNLNLEDKVIFTGFKENPYPYIKHADVFVLSSRNEGLPNVLIEAQFLGKPCVATTCIPIISRIIQEGTNGFLTPPENPSRLAEAMIFALNLNNVNTKYKPASVQDFKLLFNGVLPNN